MELLKDLYKIYSPSNGEKRMRKFIRKWITDNVPDADVWTDNMGNMYVRKGGGDSYPCIVAHTDQVQDLHSKDFTVLESNGILMGYSPKNHRQEGLGADDKNGIWVALKCLQKYDTMKCAFFMGEEIGCVGSSACDMHFFDDCRFVVQCDRRNAGDLITHIWDTMASDEFVAATRYMEYGYSPTSGAMTDVAELRTRGLKCSAVNMSCGYYEPHTDYEFTVVAELENCLRFVENIVECCTIVYDYETAGHGWGTVNSDVFYDRYMERSYQMSEMMQCMDAEAELDPNFPLGWFYMTYADAFDMLSYTDFEKAYEEIQQECLTEKQTSNELLY